MTESKKIESKNSKENKEFDCIEMKREIQRRINEQREGKSAHLKLDPKDLPEDLAKFMKNVRKLKVGERWVA